MVGKRKIRPQERLIANYPPIPKKILLEDMNSADDDDMIIDPGEDISDYNVKEDENNYSDSDDDSHVPKNCVVDFTAAIKFGKSRNMSVRDIAGMINYTSVCHGLTDEIYKVSCHKVWTVMKQLDQQAVKEHNEKITGSKWLGCDGRVDTVPQLKGKSIKEDHITIIDGITGDYKDHITPEPIVGLNENGSDSHGAGSAPALALALYDFLEVTNGVDTIEGFNLDGCPTNVGGGDKQEGAIYFLERVFLDRPLMISVGMLHLTELLLRHIALDFCGLKTYGPYDFSDNVGKRIKRVKDGLKSACEFEPIETNLPFDIPAKLLQTKDQRYLYDILMAINRGPTDPLFEDEGFMNRSPGEIGHARWLNLMNNSGRLYVQMTRPEDGKVNEMGLNLEEYESLKFIVFFGTKVYAPTFFKIKKYPDLKEGPQHYFDIIQLAKSVLDKEPMDIIKKVLTTNGFMTHPELVLYWGIRSETHKKQAVEMILKIRKRAKNKKVRKFMVPKNHIDFDATNPYELAGDIDKLPKKFVHEPNLTKCFTKEELLKYANGEMELEFPFIKLHNVDIGKNFFIDFNFPCL